MSTPQQWADEIRHHARPVRRQATSAMSAAEFRRRLFDAFYCVPNGFDTLDGYQRATHEDLQHKSGAELERELDQLRIRLMFDDEADAWLLQRYQKLEAAVRRARSGR